jgi:large subunit ribosomal protein LX
MGGVTVSGTFQARDGPQQFVKEVEADNEDVAVEYVYSRFGSEHGLKRTQVTVEEVAR